MRIAKFFSVLVLSLTLFACQQTPKGDVYIFTSFREPSVSGLQYLYSTDGYHWDTLGGVWMAPEVGNDVKYVDAFSGDTLEPTFYPQHVLRDPSIIQGPDSLFHLVWTAAWKGCRGFGYACSKDLVHWSEQRIIPVMPDTATNNVWAPELFYDDVNEEYIIIWSSGIRPENYTKADYLGANASHRPYYTKTKDFKTFTPAAPYYDAGFNTIDGFLVKRGEGDYVFLVKDNRKPGYSHIFCVSGPTPEGPFANPTPAFTPTYSEGPCVVKVGDEWLIYYDSYKEGRYGAVSTTDFETFTPIDSLISVPAGHKHGTIVKISAEQFKTLQKAVR